MKHLDDRKIALTLDAKAKSWLAQAGYHPVFGARALKRLIQRSLQDPLAQLILEGKGEDGAAVKGSAGKRGAIGKGAGISPRTRGARPPGPPVPPQPPPH